MFFVYLLLVGGVRGCLDLGISYALGMLHHIVKLDDLIKRNSPKELIMKMALVVDAPLIRRKVGELLGNYGFDQIIEAENGQEAVALAVAHKPVLIVMDVTMPVMNGINAANKIGIQAPTPIVLLTANADSETISQAREAGVMSCLLKPFRDEQLYAAVELTMHRFIATTTLQHQVDKLEQTLETRKLVDKAKGGFMGSFAVWGADDAAALAGDYSAGYSSGADWFFQMVFCGAACSVVSGCVAERIKLWAFLLFCVVLTGIIYPIQGSWVWGGGWLAEMGFSDYAGSTLVHSVGGWAALTGAIILGARTGKYTKDGRVNPLPGSNIPMATLGSFILWMGWFGFNGGSALVLGVASSAIEQGNVYINTNLAACGGMIAAMILVQLMYKKVDVTMALNGALAGLVSITAGPAAPTPGVAVIIGAVGGMLVVFAILFFDKLKIDDVVGALSVHLVCGIWGTLAVPFSNAETSFSTQLIGVLSIGAFVVTCSTVVWLVLKFTIGIRVSEEEEFMGSDISEIGVEAYPDFQPVHMK